MALVEKLKGTEWAGSLAVLVWEWGIKPAVDFLIKIKVFAMVGTVIATVVGVLYGAGAWINSFSWSGWVVAVGTAIIFVLVVSALVSGLLAWASERRSRAKRARVDLEVTSPIAATADMANVSSLARDNDEEIRRAIAEVNTTMLNLFKDSDKRLEKVSGNLDDQIRAANERIQSHANSLRLENKMLADKILALKVFYEMRRRRRTIDRLNLLLERPLRQSPELRDWTPWGRRFKRYEVAIHGFASLVGIYYPDQANALIRVDPNVYRKSDGQFAPENFPDPGTAHDFKTFRQWSSAYEAVADDLINMVDGKT